MWPINPQVTLNVSDIVNYEQRKRDRSDWISYDRSPRWGLFGGELKSYHLGRDGFPVDVRDPIKMRFHESRGSLRTCLEFVPHKGAKGLSPLFVPLTITIEGTPSLGFLATGVREDGNAVEADSWARLAASIISDKPRLTPQTSEITRARSFIETALEDLERDSPSNDPAHIEYLRKIKTGVHSICANGLPAWKNLAIARTSNNPKEIVEALELKGLRLEQLKQPKDIQEFYKKKLFRKNLTQQRLEERERYLGNPWAGLFEDEQWRIIIVLNKEGWRQHAAKARLRGIDTGFVEPKLSSLEADLEAIKEAFRVKKIARNFKAGA